MGGIVLAAGYMLWMLQRVAWGPVQKHKTTLFQDLRGRELATVVPLATLVLLIGLYPGPLLQMMDSTVTGLVEHLDVRQAMVLSRNGSSRSRVGNFRVSSPLATASHRAFPPPGVTLPDLGRRKPSGIPSRARSVPAFRLSKISVGPHASGEVSAIGLPRLS